MDRRERMDIPQEVLLAALRGRQADIWTALPATVESYDATKRTVTLQPTIQAQYQDKEGKITNITLPVLPDVPVLFPGAGGFVLTFPIAAGDEGLVVFSSRCIDAWWQSGGVQPQAENRMHDLSDGIFIPGPLSQAQELADVDTSTVQLRSNDGLLSLELDPATSQINLKALGGLWVNGIRVNVP